MNTLRGRLILSHTLALLLVTPLIGVALAYLLETQVLLVVVSNDLAREANLIADTLQSRPEVWRDPHQAALFVTRTEVATGRHLYLLSSAGQLWASNDQGRPGWPLDTPDMALASISQRRVLVSYDGYTPRAGVLLPVSDDRRVVGVLVLARTFDDAASPFMRL